MKLRYLALLGVSILLLSGSSAAADVNAGNYCSTGDGGNDDDWISSVDFDSISTSVYDLGYRDMTSHSATVKPGASKQISVYIDQQDSWDQYLAVWIDTDQDGSIQDETRQEMGSISSPGTVSGTVDIPASANDGPTLMRVSEEYAGYPGPCEQMYYGGIRDYTLVIEGSAPDKPTNPSPSDGGTVYSSSPKLSALVKDPNGDPMDVRFYRDRAGSTYTETFTLTIDSEYDTESYTINSPSGRTIKSGEILWAEAQGDLQGPSGEEVTASVEGTSIGQLYTNEQCGGSYERVLSNYNIDSEVQGKTSFTITADPAYEVDVDCGGWTAKVKFKVQYSTGGDQLIGTASNVPSGSRASVEMTGLSCPNSYSWYAVADDGSKSTKSDTFSFQYNCNSKPTVSNPRPAKSTGTSPANTRSPSLKVDVSDADGDTMNVSFYNATASSGTLYRHDVRIGQWDHSQTDGANSLSELSRRVDDGSEVTGKDGETMINNINCGGSTECNLFVSSDTYGTCVTGYIYAPSSGTYSFATDSDDASDFFINVPSTSLEHCDSVSSGNRVASFYGSHGQCNCWSHNGQVSLSKGYHPFVYRMSDRGGGDVYQLAWKKPSDSSFSIVPSSRMYHKETKMKTVVDWDRVNEGDTLTDFENRMTQVRNSMGEWENNGNKIRWSEAGTGDPDHFKYYREINFSNTGKARLRMRFHARSYEASGITFYAVDSAGNTYVFKCEDDGEVLDDGASCGYSDGTDFTWTGTFTVDAPNELTRFYIASEHDDCCYDGGDDSNLYRFNLKVEKPVSGGGKKLIGWDTVSGSGTASVTWSGLKVGEQYNWTANVTDQKQVATSGPHIFNVTTTSNRITSFSVYNSSVNHSYRVGFTAWHRNGDDKIQRCYLRVTGAGVGRTYRMSLDRGFGNSTEARCRSGWVHYNDTDAWTHLQRTNIRVNVTDVNGKTDVETAVNSFPNHEPQISLSYEDYYRYHRTNISAVVYDGDGSGSTGSGPANWWNSNWQYRKPVTVQENSGRSLSNYQVKVTVDTASLISAGKMQPDCSDMRFVGSGHSSTLDYWLKSGCDTSSTTVWVQVPSISASGSKDIYMYYGNPSASSASSPEQTMYIYDLHGSGYDGNLYGSANYHSGSNFLELTDTVDGQTGSIRYPAGTPSPGFYATWEWYTGDGTGADSNNLKAWHEGTNFEFEDPSGNGVGYILNDHDDCGGLAWNPGNPQCGDIEGWYENPAKSSWRTATAWGIRNGDTLRYYFSTIGRTVQGSWTNTNFPPGDQFGWSGRTGGLNNHHWVRSLTVRKYTRPTPTTSIGSETAYGVGGTELENRCRVVMRDGEGNLFNKTGDFDKTYGTEDQGLCSYSNMNGSMTGFQPAEEINVSVRAFDVHGEDGWTTDIHEVANTEPLIELIRPEEGAKVNNRQVQLKFNVTDPNYADDVDHAWVFNSTQAMPGELLHEEPVDNGDNVSTVWNGVPIGNVYPWTATVSDPYENSSKTFSFVRRATGVYRTRGGFQYDYSTVITEVGEPEYVGFTARNRFRLNKTLRLSISGVQAEFTNNSMDSITFELPAKDSRTLQIRINATSTGKKRLNITVNNQELNYSQTFSFPVLVLPKRTTLNRDVPGPGLLYVILIGMTAAMVYIRRY